MSKTSEPIEALCTYFDSYIDFTEELPNDISRHISEIHEIDIERRKLIRKLNDLRSELENTNNLSDEATKTILEKADTIVKNFQHMSDDKVALVQRIHELIQNKSDELGFHSQKAESEVITLQSRLNSSNADQSGGGGGGGGGESSGEGSSNHNGSNDDERSTEIVIEKASSSSAGKRCGGKRGSTGAKRGGKRGDSPPIIYIPGPNEPVYCLCRKISFGNMVGCDNKKCKYEWFHFECVSLTSKPKGKWFCPDCRGKRSNQPKKPIKSK